MRRIDFIRTSCTLCALAGTGMFMNFISACASSEIFKTAISNNKISIPVSLFAQNSLLIVRPSGVGYDIALRKESDEVYTALLLRCTHADNPLNSTGNGFQCNLHGSTFNKEGLVTKGPAEFSLTKYKTEIL